MVEATIAAEPAKKALRPSFAVDKDLQDESVRTRADRAAMPAMAAAAAPPPGYQYGAAQGNRRSGGKSE